MEKVQVHSVQVLRAAAALLVVFGHAQAIVSASAGRRGEAFATTNLLPWGAGVDLFFVISGFVMVISSERLFAQPGAAREFLLRRVIRIVPLYWLALGYFLFKSLALGRDLPELAATIAAFLFIPFENNKGMVLPIYEPGWTLNYEMLFYALFAACLWARRAKAVALTAGILMLFVLISGLCDLHSLQLRFWSQPIVLEFAFGMGIALAYRRGVSFGPWFSTGLLCAAVTALLLDFLKASSELVVWLAPSELPRLIHWGLPAAAIVAALVLAEGREKRTASGPFATCAARVGDASYGLYLLHPFALGAFVWGWTALGLHHVAGPWVCVACGMAVSIATALAVHAWLEMPLLNALRPMIERGTEPARSTARPALTSP